MKVDMIMPQMGESIAEATISKWLKKAGEKVEKDELILEISTDKVDSEIPSPAAGVLGDVLFKEGDVVPVKTKIATIDTAGGAGAAASSAPAAVSAPVAQAPVAAVIQQPTPVSAPVAESRAAQSENGKFYSPLVRELAAKHNIPLAELDAVPGTGTGGRVSKNDLMGYISTRSSGAAAAVASAPSYTSAPQAAAPRAAAAPAPAKAKAPAPAMPSLDWSADGTKVVPMDKMRQSIAEHMVRSKHTSPHVYSVQEVDVTPIAKWRARHKAEFESKEGFGLSFTPFFLEAAVRALLQFPIVNSSVDGNTVIMKRHVNLGCAVALGSTGLIVPVIKRAEERNLVGLARGLNDLASRARNKKLLPDDVMGGTFTVTNPGVFGTMIGTPIINQPQAAILCLGAIKKRPVVIDDMIAIRDICYLTLSYDHRIIDGSAGGQFLAFVREYLENWDMERTLY